MKWLLVTFLGSYFWQSFRKVFREILDFLVLSSLLTRERLQMIVELWDGDYIDGKLKSRRFQIYIQFLPSRPGIRETRRQSLDHLYVITLTT